MQVGDIVRIKDHYMGKLGIIVVCGTWSVDVRIFKNGLCPRIAKEHCEVVSESR